MKKIGLTVILLLTVISAKAQSCSGGTTTIANPQDTQAITQSNACLIVTSSGSIVPSVQTSQLITVMGTGPGPGSSLSGISITNNGTIAYNLTENSSLLNNIFIFGGSIEVDSIVNTGVINASASGLGTDAWGIRNLETINTIINTGSITAIATGGGGAVAYGIGNYSTITTLNNAQGGNSSSAATTALTYDGGLPINYNIIINSPISYGQLAVTSGSGLTAFGIYAGSTITTKLYRGVLQGLTTGNVGATRTGTYGNFGWTLALANGSSTIWDLIFTGTSAADTQSSLGLSAQRLKGIYNLQSTAVVNGLTYDCQLFDANNICLSTGGRYSNNHGASGYTTSALLIGAYRLTKNVRLGAWVDQNLSTNTVTGTKLSNSKPLFGVFGAWAENRSGEGYEVKVSAGYGDKDLTLTRDVIGTSENGKGSTKLNSQAISTVSSYGFKLSNDVLASPYVGIQYSRVASSAYTEGSTADVTAPLTYSRLSQENVSILAGLKLSAKLDPNTALFGSVGVEQNVNNRSGQYSATGVDGLTSIEFNSNVQKTRATASAGIYYDIDKKQRVSLSGIYREEAFSPTATTSVLATYTVGL